MTIQAKIVSIALILVSACAFFLTAWNWTDPSEGLVNIRSDLPYQTNESCRGCHGAIYEEWESSVHRMAFTDAIYQVERHISQPATCRNNSAGCHETLSLPEGALPRGFNINEKCATADTGNPDCLPCHTPTELFAVGIGNRPIVRADDHKSGVNCLTCHSKPGTGMAATIQIPVDKTDEIQDNCRPVYDFRAASNELCRPCHDQHETSLEWNVYASRVDSPKTCVECHMPSVQRPIVPGGPVRESHVHTILGGHYYLERYLRETSAQNAAPERRPSERPGIVPSPENLPAEFRYPVSLAISSNGDGRTFSVHVTNENAGHNFPTDDRYKVGELRLRVMGGSLLNPEEVPAYRLVDFLGATPRQLTAGKTLLITPADFRNPALYRPGEGQLFENLQFTFRDEGGDRNTLPPRTRWTYDFAMKEGASAISIEATLIYRLTPLSKSDDPAFSTILMTQSYDLIGHPEVQEPPELSSENEIIVDNSLDDVFETYGEAWERWSAPLLEISGNPDELSAVAKRAGVLALLKLAEEFPLKENGMLLEEMPESIRALDSSDRAESLALVQLLRNDSFRVRSWAAAILGMRKIKEAAPFIATLLRDEHPWAQAAAAFALGEIGDRSTLIDFAERLFREMDLKWHLLPVQTPSRMDPEFVSQALGERSAFVVDDIYEQVDTSATLSGIQAPMVPGVENAVGLALLKLGHPFGIRKLADVLSMPIWEVNPENLDLLDRFTGMYAGGPEGFDAFTNWLRRSIDNPLIDRGFPGRSDYLAYGGGSLEIANQTEDRTNLSRLDLRTKEHLEAMNDFSYYVANRSEHVLKLVGAWVKDIVTPYAFSGTRYQKDSVIAILRASRAEGSERTLFDVVARESDENVKERARDALVTSDAAKSCETLAEVLKTTTTDETALLALRLWKDCYSAETSRRTRNLRVGEVPPTEVLDSIIARFPATEAARLAITMKQ
ncbi:MAG: HEAT repeat domain-containing protein [Planctomycetes bacterium]|nr:HEAT repeat domain-containing protein [Planctomycetota bacterium]